MEEFDPETLEGMLLTDIDGAEYILVKQEDLPFGYPDTYRQELEWECFLTPFLFRLQSQYSHHREYLYQIYEYSLPWHWKPMHPLKLSNFKLMEMLCEMFRTGLVRVWELRGGIESWVKEINEPKKTPKQKRPALAKKKPDAIDEAQTSGDAYWEQVQENAVTEQNPAKYLAAGMMKSLGDIGYSLAREVKALSENPGEGLKGVGKSVINFGPEMANAATAATKKALDGYSLIAEQMGVEEGTFDGFRETEAYQIKPLADYDNDAQKGGALLAGMFGGGGAAREASLAAKETGAIAKAEKNANEINKLEKEKAAVESKEALSDRADKGMIRGEGDIPINPLDSVTELSPGEKGSWNKALNGALKPNHKYKVGDYLYETDEHARVSRVSGELDLNTRDRNTYQQGKSAKEEGIKDGLSDDDGGHLIASIFDGAGEQINYAPMNSNLNRGAWKSMENKWAQALSEKPPKKVKVDIQPIYEGTNKRPEAFKVKYWIDGKKKTKFFENKPGG